MMFDSYALLKLVLFEIEKNIKDKVNANSLAKAAALSPSHLQRLFRLAFEKPLASYIRSRKLAASIEVLLKTELRVIDIAEEYGFGYEQSYIRAFKREYGMTPGEARSCSQIIRIVPPLLLLEKNKMGDGLFFGPEFVMVPEFHMVGRLHQMPYDKSLEEAPKAAKHFWLNDRETIINRLGDDVYIGLTRIPRDDTGYSYYLPSVPVHKSKNPPQGLHNDVFSASLCAKFHYIGRHHYFDLNRDIAKGMYKSISAYAGDDGRYTLSVDSPYFERIDKSDYDGVFCKLEWFTPVTEKPVTEID